MTEAQEKKLDAMMQQIPLERWKHRSLISGKPAVLIHHFYGRRNVATRWYFPNAIPLTYEEHLLIHNEKKDEMEEEIKQILGIEWFLNLRRVSNKTAKYIVFEDVVAHLNGEKEHYIPSWYV